MKKIITAVLAAAIGLSVCFSFMGCHDPDAGKLRIVAHIQNEDFLEEVIAMFEDETGIQVKGLYGVDFMSLIDTKSPADMIISGNLQLSPIQHLLEDLNPLIKEHFAGDESKADEFLQNFPTAMLESMTMDDKLLILPTGGNVSLLYYNKKIFDDNAAAVRAALRVDRPEMSDSDSIYPNDTWSWDDYSRVGFALTKYNGNNPTQWGSSTILNWWGEYLIYIRQMGGDFYREDGETVAFDSAAFASAMEFMKSKVSGATKFAPNPASTAGGNDALGGFAGGKTAMEFGGHTGNWPSYNAVGLNWDISTLPRPKNTDGSLNVDARGGELASEGYGIYNRSNKKSDAMKFLAFMFSEEVLQLSLRMGKFVPINSYKDMLLTETDRQAPYNIEALYDEMGRGLSLPRNKYFEGSAQGPFTDPLGKYLKGDLTLDQFVTNATNSVNSYVSSQY